ncbi:DUF317 domain-containing protein [Streptomyces sp. NPDC088789]|uniref:DUF317 domain-containing protein n=1 Tax=Streptomyces sp. NPDC088789 TaxID=3365899 RepID=UPI003815BE7C
MDRLAALDGSQYTVVPGSRFALDALASTVHCTTIAAAELAGILAANPLPGTAFHGAPDTDTVRALLHQDASPLMEEHRTEALEQLDLAYTSCSYLATIITRDVKKHTGPHIPTQPAPALTPPAQRQGGHAMNGAPADDSLYATTPRFLAGPGDVRLVTRTLRAAGWTSSSETDTIRLTYTSPQGDTTAILQPVPSGFDHWWHITGSHNDRPWTAYFGGNLPSEVLAEFVGALTRPAPEHPAQPWPALTAAGWQHLHDDSARHPSQILGFHRVDGAGPAASTWIAEASTPFGPHFWDCELDSVPVHLVTVFAAALAREEPVLRTRYGVPDLDYVNQTVTGTQDPPNTRSPGTSPASVTAAGTIRPATSPAGGRGPLR